MDRLEKIVVTGMAVFVAATTLYFGGRYIQQERVEDSPVGQIAQLMTDNYDSRFIRLNGDSRIDYNASIPEEDIPGRYHVRFVDRDPTVLGDETVVVSDMQECRRNVYNIRNRFGFLTVSQDPDKNLVNGELHLPKGEESSILRRVIDYLSTPRTYQRVTPGESNETVPATIERSNMINTV